MTKTRALQLLYLPCGSGSHTIYRLYASAHQPQYAVHHVLLHTNQKP
jgi:hypothetical protein